MFSDLVCELFDDEVPFLFLSVEPDVAALKFKVKLKGPCDCNWYRLSCYMQGKMTVALLQATAWSA